MKKTKVTEISANTINELVIRVMKLMDDNHSLHQHISQLNNRIFELSSTFGTHVNSLGKALQECQTKQAELEKAFVEQSNTSPSFETKIN